MKYIIEYHHEGKWHEIAGANLYADALNIRDYLQVHYPGCRVRGD